MDMDGSRDFDFWVGTWDCSWEGGAARNVVDWACDGRVLRERFDGAAHGLVGTSISVYDRSAHLWVQTWMDSDGSWFHLTGGMRDGALELLTTTCDGEGYRKRMRFAGAVFAFATLLVATAVWVTKADDDERDASVVGAGRIGNPIQDSTIPSASDFGFAVSVRGGTFVCSMAGPETGGFAGFRAWLARASR